ncbi:hypothetical protein GJ496_007646 [Pomphorhynchus laevis]|nr:hypothetical protein GJ496_007646 [Pomphorhynchus laevis]
MSQESKNTKSQTELLLEQAKSVMSKIEEQKDHFYHLRCCAEMNHYNHQEKLNKIMEESFLHKKTELLRWQSYLYQNSDSHKESGCESL